MTDKGILSSDANLIDPNIARKKAIFDEQLQRDALTGGPLFAKLELSITGLCSRRCVFCPRVDPKVYPNVREHMDLALYEMMLRELASAGWAGTMSFSGFGEPLMHPEFERMISQAGEVLPKARRELVTNGDFLDAGKARRLFDAGLDAAIVSLYDGPEQLDEFLRMRDEAGATEEQLLLRIRYKPPEEHHGLTISNRAGAVDLGYLGIAPLDEPLGRPCFYPHYSVFVEYDGTVLLCCNDWLKKKPLGNVRDSGLLAIWRGSEMDHARKLLLQGDRLHQSPCRECNVHGTRMGLAHARAWAGVYGQG